MTHRSVTIGAGTGLFIGVIGGGLASLAARNMNLGMQATTRGAAMLGIAGGVINGGMWQLRNSQQQASNLAPATLNAEQSR